MQYGQQQLGPMNNDTAIKILWGGIVFYILGLVLPQINVPIVDDSLTTWDLLTGVGILMILTGIGLTYYAITRAKLFLSVKKFGVTSSIIMLVPIGAIYSQFIDLNVISENILGVEIYELGIGYYLLWLGVILSTIGSFKAQSIPQYKGYPTYLQPQFEQQYQQPQYQQSQYSQPQNQYQQPVQPPSYIEPEQQSVHPPSSIKSDQYPETTPKQSTQQGKFCGNCGHQNDIEAKFCVNCGQTMN